MDPVISKVDNRGVATLTINRPDVANAFNDEVVYSMITALDDLSNQDHIRVLLINSVGNNFSGGIDARWLSDCLDSGNHDLLNNTTQMARLFSTLHYFPMPTVISVQGKAFSDAVGLIACCDVAIGCTDTELIINDVLYGLPPALISPYLVKVIGEREARFHSLTDEPIKAEKALTLGLINMVVETEHLRHKTELVIDSVLRSHPVVLRKTKALLQFCSDEPYDDAEERR